MYSVEDQSLALAAELVHGVERELPPPEYQLTYRPPRWPSAGEGGRYGHGSTCLPL